MELQTEYMMNLSGADAILDLSTNDCVLDLSKTARATPPIRQDFPQFSTTLNDFFVTNGFWRVPPFQSSYALNVNHGVANPEPHDTTRDSPSSYCSSNTSNECYSGSDNTRSRTKKTQVKDQAYYERRIKNNIAAKKSRDAKRRRDNETSAKVIILQAENQRLREYLAACKCSEVHKALFANCESVES